MMYQDNTSVTSTCTNRILTKLNHLQTANPASSLPCINGARWTADELNVCCHNAQRNLLQSNNRCTTLSRKLQTWELRTTCMYMNERQADRKHSVRLSLGFFTYNIFFCWNLKTSGSSTHLSSRYVFSKSEGYLIIHLLQGVHAQPH